MTDHENQSHASTPLRVVRHRAPALLFVFGLWAAVVCFRLAQIMIFDRDEYLRQMAAASWHQGVIPAVRGRICDRTGRPLAWSSRQFAVRWRIPPDPADAQHDWQLLDAALAVAEKPGVVAVGDWVTVKDDLSPQEFARLSEAVKNRERLEIVGRFVRHQAHGAQLRKRLGDTRTKEGMEIGISGEELAHDSLLRGRPGLYKVMLDSNGEWISDTWEQIREVRPGYDVYLPLRVQPQHN